MKVLVYGWYHHDNIGDDLFAEAFVNLFPDFDFDFVEEINARNLLNTDVVFIGGGSFLSERINISSEVFESLKQKKIFYLGVGAETDINAGHQYLMGKAKLIALRSNTNLDKILSINPNTIVVPDLVYCLTPSVVEEKIDKSILVLPNMVVVPQWNAPHWKHTAWEHFKNEFAQVLDGLVDQGYLIRFLPMCTNHEQDDKNAALEIISRMVRRDNRYLLDKHNQLYNFQSITQLMSRYSAVITQRYHGAILAHIVGVPCMTIHHHDKLKNSTGNRLSYYSISKSHITSELNTLIESNVTEVLPIDRDIFDSLKQRVMSLI